MTSSVSLWDSTKKKFDKGQLIQTNPHFNLRGVPMPKTDQGVRNQRVGKMYKLGFSDETIAAIESFTENNSKSYHKQYVI